MLEKIKEISQKLRTFENIFEVGAYSGTDLPYLLENWPEANIHCFECEPLNFEILSKNYGSNTKIFLENRAVSNRDGELQFNYLYPKVAEGNDVGMNWMCAAGNSYYGNSKEHISIPCVSLDTYCREKMVVPNALLMDIEGAEYDALQGADSILCCPGLQMVVFEFRNDKQLTPYTFDDIASLLKQYNFKEELTIHHKFEGKTYYNTGDSVFIREDGLL